MPQMGSGSSGGGLPRVACMAFDAWQVAAMARMYDQNRHMSVADLVPVLQKIMPQLSKGSINDLLFPRTAPER
jgi:hypothetical protein